MILEGWQAGVLQECLGDMGQLERATVNDYHFGGQQVDRKMSIHERGWKGDSMNLWLVILTATWPGWRIYKIYLKKKRFVINIKALPYSILGKRGHSFHKRKSCIVFTIFKKVFKKLQKRRKGVFYPFKETLIKLCRQSKSHTCCGTAGNVVLCTGVQLAMGWGTDAVGYFSLLKAATWGLVSLLGSGISFENPHWPFQLHCGSPFPLSCLPSPRLKLSL